MGRAVPGMKWRDGNRHRGGVPNPRDSSRLHYRAVGRAGMAPLLVVMLVVLVLLAGCGGDGEGPTRPGSRIGEAGPKPGTPAVGAPGIESGPASVWAAAVVGGADALFATGVHEESGFGARQVHDTGCSGLSCSASGGGEIGIGNADGLASAGVVGQTSGIDLVSDVDAESWGGWMRHGGFGVLLEREGMGSELREVRYGLALGKLTEVAEGRDVRATWRGRMVGATEAGGFSEGRLRGVAMLTYRSIEALGRRVRNGRRGRTDRRRLHGDRERFERRILS